MNLTKYLEDHGFYEFEGYCEQVPGQVDDLIKLTNTPNINMMEIGFNAGHSSDIFLKNNPTLTLTSFDIGSHDYIYTGKNYIDSNYPNRHTLIIGDSTSTIPAYINETSTKFDVLFIDGCHDYNIVIQDVDNCMKLAHKDSIIILDDTIYTEGWEASWTIDPTRVWKEYTDAKKINTINTKDYTEGRGMSWGTYNM